MRKLVMLVGMVTLAALLSLTPSRSEAALIPSWENSNGNLGFWPLANEVSVYQNYDDAGDNRGRTLQIVSINSFRLFTQFNFELTADYNFDLTPGLGRDHYVELSLVKPVTSFVSLNIQRVISSFEAESINQMGVRFVF